MSLIISELFIVEYCKVKYLYPSVGKGTFPRGVYNLIYWLINKYTIGVKGAAE